MPYQLWDLSTGNYLETLETQEEVDEAIEEYVKTWGEVARTDIGVRAATSED